MLFSECLRVSCEPTYSTQKNETRRNPVSLRPSKLRQLLGSIERICGKDPLLRQCLTFQFVATSCILRSTYTGLVNRSFTCCLDYRISRCRPIQRLAAVNSTAWKSGNAFGIEPVSTEWRLGTIAAHSLWLRGAPTLTLSSRHALLEPYPTVDRDGGIQR